MSDQILWTPTPAFQQNSQLRQYEDWLLRQKQLSFTSYGALWQWSITEVADFWESLWEYFDIKAYTPYDQVLSGQMPKARWFEGATLSYAEHIFRQADDSRPALVFQNETERTSISWAQLKEEVRAMQVFLEAQGIGKGDRVVGYLPNTPAAVVSFLAANSLGAIWSCCSPDFGVDTVIERFSQIEPKLLIATDGYRYGGKTFDRLEIVRQIQAQLPTVVQTVLVPYLNTDAELEGTISWESIMRGSDGGALIFTPVPFEHPIWVLYSSGTTGRPKAITHSTGGTLLEQFKYMAFHNDAKPGENFFWFTTTGWMMWNFLQSSLLMGATAVLFDGSPGYPNMDVLWELTAALPVHHFGTSAPYLTACMQRRLTPGKDHDLSALRSIGSTGAPLPPEAFDWVYASVKSDLWLCSMSGGTDVCTAFVGGMPYAPVQRGRIQARALGCALFAYGEKGEHLTGSLGEMVIEQPMPSMPIYFWNDPEFERYEAAYFADFPGKWRHGDWIQLYEDGSLIIQGRSDATLNRKGIRIGTAEIYNVLNKIPELTDSLVLNLEQADGSDVMPLYVVLAAGSELDDALRQKINQNLRKQCSPRHVPDSIAAVPDIPYTLSGKKMEVPVKKIFMGMDVSGSLNRDAMRNPEAMDYFIALAAKDKERKK